MEDTELNRLLAHACRVLTDEELALLAEHDVPLTGERGLRRYLAERDFEGFLALYFAEELTVPWSATHREVIKAAQDLHDRYVAGRKGRKLVYALPRGMGKSSILGRFQLLWRFLNGTSPLSLVVGNNLDAGQRLVRNIKVAYEQSDRLREDFPGVIAEEWGAQRLVNGANGCVIVGLSRGSGAIRGVSVGNSRVTLGVLDDVDDDALVRSQSEVEAAVDWAVKAFLPTGDNLTQRTSFVVVGTRIAKTSVLEYFLGSPDFEATIRKGIQRFPTNDTLVGSWERWFLEQAASGVAPAGYEEDEFWQTHRRELEAGAEVIWPQLGGAMLYTYLRYRLAHGERAFLAEVQCELPGEAMTPLGNLPRIPRSELPSEAQRLAYLDPTTSGARTADYPAFVEVLFDAPRRRLYVDFVLAEKAPYGETIQRVASRIASHQRPLEGLWVEANAHGTIVGDLLQKALSEAGRLERVVKHNSRLPKAERIAALGIYARRGQLIALDDCHEELFREWASYPRAVHDDVLDALAGIVLKLRDAGLLDVEFASKVPEEGWRAAAVPS